MTRRYQERSSPRRPLIDPVRVNALGEIVGCRLASLLDHLGVRLYKRGKMLVGPCPVHGGRRHDAFNIYPDGHSSRGNWICRSRNCHLTFKRTVIGFVWGVLSHQQLHWTQAEDRKVPFRQVLDYLCDFVGKPINEIEVDYAEMEKKNFASQMSVMGYSGQKPPPGWTREQVLRRMEIPPAYYLNRGYQAQTLIRYDVGRWLAGKGPASSMVGRLAVPVFDDDHKRVVGITARSPFEKCQRCEQFHCPSSCCPRVRHKDFAKWMNNDGFAKEHYLYNYWFARQSIQKSGVVILVESMGDVWRLEEAGITNSLGMFGCTLSDPQQIILERSGASTVVVFPHSDEAGRQSQRMIQQDLGRLFRLHFFPLPAKDIGEMTVEQVKTTVLPLLEKVWGHS